MDKKYLIRFTIYERTQYSGYKIKFMSTHHIKLENLEQAKQKAREMVPDGTFQLDIIENDSLVFTFDNIARSPKKPLKTKRVI